MSAARLLLLTAAIVLELATASCDRNTRERSVDKPSVAAGSTTLATVTFRPKEHLTSEKSLSISINLKGDSVLVDSTTVSFNNARLLSTKDLAFDLPLERIPPGRQILSVLLYKNNGKSERHDLQLTLFADSPPKKYTYKKLAVYTHDPDAYTQGLVFHNDFLFESTGTRGESSLRKVELKSGKVLKQINLEDRYFGEGLTIWNGSLIQLTWTSNTGFVYDMETFARKQTFNYPTEGWGLTVFNNELVLSDGTENLYFLDPVSFAEKRRLQVYNHEKSIGNLNELETVDGLIYANVYQTDTIVMIDPESGEVVGEINLDGLFNREGYNRRLDVLNGIAWDESNKRLFVTGKWWPKLFHIEIIDLQI